ncbi:MAG: RNA 2',3'-cyclic phosphodiesterase [Gemmataceae bacterium]
MPYRLRTFIAVEVEQFTHDRVVGLQKRLAAGGVNAKWVEPANLHITLLFLGEIDNREVPSVCDAVADVTAGLAPFPVTIAGVGAFPTVRRPRILIANVTEGAPEIVALHDAIETPLLELGCYRREARPFTPHLTLGRVRGDAASEPLSATLTKFAAWEGGQSVVREVRVYSSTLQSDGPEYAVLSRARLAGAK